ncbi:unnamed protein product [Timema podura]|uniref:WRKY19-like zinc finger domain-containing protein n=1 Tax=Timema podura TaxID=61482 RepID=A0ABN7NST0_TIMPD|nr:unnamed protein product [Timema podura]
MEREIFNVKTEPEEDLEYNLLHEEKFEIKSEIDLPIKSEECFKKEVQDYQQPEVQDYQQPEVQDYQQPEYGSRPITFPPIKEELPVMPKYFFYLPFCALLFTGAPEQGAEGKRQGNLKLSSLIGHDGTTQTKYKGEMYLFVQNKSLRREITYVKKRCEEEGCSKQARGRGKCIKHGGSKWTCKEKGCSKWALKGEIDVLNTERFLLRGSVHKKAALNGLKVEDKIYTQGEMLLETTKLEESAPSDGSTLLSQTSTL